MKLHALCLDPAERTFAYSRLEITLVASGITAKILETGYITDTIINLTAEERKITKKEKRGGLDSEYRAFEKHFTRLLKNKLDFVSTERFQARGIKGRSSETVNIMNGVILTKCKSKRIPIYMVMASQWKNWINKIVPIDDLYEVGKRCGVENHTVDTLFQCLYTASVLIEKNQWPQLTSTRCLSLVRKIRMM